MNILVTGSTGLLGQALAKRLAVLGDVCGVSRHQPSDATGARHQCCDLTDAGQVRALVGAVRPDVVVHAQALSDVDQCEREPAASMRHNVETVEHLCRALEGPGSVLVALSTDYVFDGAKGAPYEEDDEPRPLSVYGRNKLEAERRVLQYPGGVVVRPSTLFGPGRMNFCEAVIQRLQRGEPVEAFEDQTTSPTYTEDVAEGIARLIPVLLSQEVSRAPRRYHLANHGGCSRVEFAREIARQTRSDQALIRAVPMRQMALPALRPAYSVLASHSLEQVSGWALRPWHDALSAYLQQACRN